MKNKVISIFSLIILIFSMVGCFNYNEINKMTFVTSMIIDTNDAKKVLVYLDCITTYKNANEKQEKGKRMVFQGEGDTILQAVRNLNSECSNELNFSQIKAYIFTEKCAKDGIDKYLDVIRSNEDFAYKANLFTYFGDVDSLLKAKNNDEEYLGVYLEDLVKTNKNNANVLFATVNDYLINNDDKNNAAYMSSIEMDGNSDDSKVRINGGVIMKDNKLAYTMNEDDVCTYKILSGYIDKGAFQINNPDEKDKFVTLDILRNKVDSDVSIKNNMLIITKKIEMKTSLGEIQGNLSINEDVIAQLKSKEETTLLHNIQKFYSDMYSNGIDILGVRRMVQIKYPQHNVDDNMLKESKLITDIKVIIESDGLVKDSI